MSLPEALLAAIVSEGGGKVALVLGAGCSVEAPTSLPLAKKCAEDAHGSLVEDGILVEGECANPDDLSAVANAVFSKRSAQDEVVSRLPVARFRNASPNEGHKIACALLREQAVGSVLTLNFDHAMSHGLAAIGAGAEVAVISAPEHLSQLGAFSVVHLHGDADSPPEQWILRTDQLETVWSGGWQELIANRVMTAPVVVFAGLGSPAAVLVESVRRIRVAIPDHIAIHVDPVPHGSSAFAAAVNVPPERYVQSGWCDFMRDVSDRVASNHIDDVRNAVGVVLAREEWADPGSDRVLEKLGELSLLELGQLRAGWFIEPDSYMPARAIDPEVVALLVYGIALAESIAQLDAIPHKSGNFELRKGDRLLGHMVPVSGRGTRSRPTIEASLRAMGRLRSRYSFEPVVVLVTGTMGVTRVVPPEDLIAETTPDSIVAPRREPVLIDLDELRANPAVLTTALES